MSRVKKVYPAHFKILDEDKGIVEQYVSVFGNVDWIGDRVMPGFFADTLAEFKAEDAPIPVIYSHQWDNLDSWIGETMEAEEVLPGDERLPERLKEHGGLRTVYRLFLDEPVARKVLKLVKRKLLRQASFAYDVEQEQTGEDGANELLKGRLIEVGPTLRGMNELTDVVSAKAAVEELDDLMRKGGSGEATDDAEWDAQAAMSAAGNADDPAAAFRAICAVEHSAGEPSEAQHWGLPHHRSPGAPANAAAIRNARARFDSTQDVSNAEAARRHIFETHKLPSEMDDGKAAPPAGVKVGRVLSAKNEDSLRQARDLIDAVLSSLEPASEPGDGKANDEGAGTGAKSEELSPATIRALLELEELEATA